MGRGRRETGAAGTGLLVNVKDTAVFGRVGLTGRVSLTLILR